MSGQLSDREKELRADIKEINEKIEAQEKKIDDLQVKARATKKEYEKLLDGAPEKPDVKTEMNYAAEDLQDAKTNLTELKEKEKDYRGMLKKAQDTAAGAGHMHSIRAPSASSPMSDISSTAPTPADYNSIMEHGLISFRGSDVRDYDKCRDKRRGTSAKNLQGISMYLVMKAAKLGVANFADNKLTLNFAVSPNDSASQVGSPKISTTVQAFEETDIYAVVSVEYKTEWYNTYEGVVTDGVKKTTISCGARPDFIILHNPPPGDIPARLVAPSVLALPDSNNFVIVEEESGEKGQEYGGLQLTYQLLAFRKTTNTTKSVWGFFISNDGKVYPQLVTGDGGVYYDKSGYPLASLPDICDHIFSGVQCYAVEIALRNPDDMAVPTRPHAFENTPKKRPLEQ